MISQAASGPSSSAPTLGSAPIGHLARLHLLLALLVLLLSVPGGQTRMQLAQDEFNSSHTHNQPANRSELQLELDHQNTPLTSLKLHLLKLPYAECCPSWQNLSQNQEILEELKRRKPAIKGGLKLADLLNELKRTFLNVTYLAIDGQPGQSEREQYYNFLDGIHYYLRLLNLANGYLATLDSQQQANTTAKEAEMDRTFRRQLNSIKFRAAQDPFLTIFIEELTQPSSTNHTSISPNSNFDFYENFLSHTKFGQLYAKNVSMIRKAVIAFDKTYSQLINDFSPSNYTKPSKQYSTIQRLAQQLYTIRHQIEEQINPKIASNRQDVARILETLNKLAQTRSYVKILGDSYDPNVGEQVNKLTHLLDLYLANNMTHVSFYDQLADLPERFIILGIKIAHDYENKEISQYNRLEDNFLSWPNTAYETTQPTPTTNTSADARQQSLSLLSRLFS